MYRIELSIYVLTFWQCFQKIVLPFVLLILANGFKGILLVSHKLQVIFKQKIFGTFIWFELHSKLLRDYVSVMQFQIISYFCKLELWKWRIILFEQKINFVCSGAIRLCHFCSWYLSFKACSLLLVKLS